MKSAGDRAAWDGQVEASIRRRLVDEGVSCDYGLVDASLALTRVGSIEPGETETERALQQALIARLDALVEQRKLALTSRLQGSLRRHAAKFFRASVDFIDSILRRRRADQIVAQLVAGRISHAAAAAEMRALVARGKARDE